MLLTGLSNCAIQEYIVKSYSVFGFKTTTNTPTDRAPEMDLIGFSSAVQFGLLWFPNEDDDDL